MLTIGRLEREPSSDHTPGHTQEMEDDARRRASGEGWHHPDLEAKDRDDRDQRQHQRPEVDARHDRSVEREREAAHWKGLAKYRVKREPDCQIEDHADDRGGDPREGAVRRLVVSELLDKRRAEPDPQKARDKGGPGRQRPPRTCPVDDRSRHRRRLCDGPSCGYRLAERHGYWRSGGSDARNPAQPAMDPDDRRRAGRPRPPLIPRSLYFRGAIAVESK